MPILIKQVSPEEIFELRQAVLRPDQPLSASQYPGDNDPGTAVFAAYLDNITIGTATVSPEACPWQPTAANAWRVRGMAVLPEYRSSGLGARLLETVISYARSHHAQLAWCNARIRARDFYARHGFHQHGEVFELPLIGEHFKMWRNL